MPKRTRSTALWAPASLALLVLLSLAARLTAAGPRAATPAAMPAAPATAPATPAVLDKPALKIEEAVLYGIPADVKVADTIVSPDSRHVACVEARTEGANRTFDVCIDNTPGPRVQWVVGRSLLFSPDGSRFSYQTQQDGPISVVVESVDRALGNAGAPGGTGGTAADGGSETRPAGKGYWMAGHVVFSPDGRHAAYAAQPEKGRYVMVADGNESDAYDGLDDSQILFSPAGNRLAYRALRDAGGEGGAAGAAGAAGRKQFFVVDGTPQPAFQGVLEPTFSANGARFGYRAKQDKNEFYVIDGKPGPAYEVVGGLTFSADGRRYAYAAGKAGKQMLLVDGKAYKPFDGISEIAFSPDGHRVAISAQTGAKWNAVVDGTPSAAYDGIAALRFSPDSQRIAFVAGVAYRQLIVADGRPGPAFEGVTAVTFSPDSRRLAYLAVDRLGKGLMADGRKVGPADAFAFSPDGRHLARTVLLPDGRWGLAVDGTDADVRYDGFPLGSRIVFDSPDTFRIVGGRGSELLRVEVHIH